MLVKCRYCDKHREEKYLQDGMCYRCVLDTPMRRAMMQMLGVEPDDWTQQEAEWEEQVDESLSKLESLSRLQQSNMGRKTRGTGKSR